VCCNWQDSTNASTFFFVIYCACFTVACFNNSLIGNMLPLMSSLTCFFISFTSCWRLSLSFTRTPFSTLSRRSSLMLDSIFLAASVTIWVISFTFSSSFRLCVESSSTFSSNVSMHFCSVNNASSFTALCIVSTRFLWNICVLFDTSFLCRSMLSDICFSMLFRTE